MELKTIKNYSLPNEELWVGRKSNPKLGNQYWYQEIQLLDANKVLPKKIDIALIGYECDEGVRRNLGRVGAKNGPNSVKKRLAKIPIHINNLAIADLGNIICVDKKMESAQLSLSFIIELLLRKKIFPIAIGGGHDISYGHFTGIYNVFKKNEKNKIGILNFDAHFDLRPSEIQNNSGTPFNQILTEFKNVEYFIIGIQKQSNTKELFDIANENKVEFIYDYECINSDNQINKIKNRLKPFLTKIDHFYITIDLDGFSSAYAPGVSAPSPFGFSPKFIFKILTLLFKTKKVISLDIAEMNPKYDINNSTEILASKIIDFCTQKIEEIK